MASPEYPKTAVNKVGRLANRGTFIFFALLRARNRILTSINPGTYDYATIHSLVNACPILHVSFVDPEHPFPVVLPMLGCTGNYEVRQFLPSHHPPSYNNNKSMKTSTH